MGLYKLWLIASSNRRLRPATFAKLGHYPLKPELDSQLDLAGIESGREAERICRTGVLSAFHPIVSQGCCSRRSVHAGIVHAIEKIEGFEDRCYAPAIFDANREVLGRPKIETHEIRPD